MARQLLSQRGLSAHAAAAFLAALLLVPLSSLFWLNINNVPEVYFPPSAPAVVFEKELRKTFPEDQVMAALFHGPDIYSQPVLSALDRIARRLQAHPLTDRVFALTNFDHIAGSEDGFVVEPLIDPRRLADQTPAEWFARVRADRFAPGLLASKDGNVIALILRPQSLENSLQRLALEQALRLAIDEAGLGGRLHGIAGQLPLDVAELRSMMRDSLIFIPATTVVGLLFIWWMFRHVMAVLLAGACIGAVAITTVSMLVLSGKPYTLISAMIPPLMAALTVALLIHFYNALLHAAHRGLQGKERVLRALHEVRRPARFTSLTTAAGLASLGLSPIQPIQTFGLCSAAGMAVIYFVVVGLLPPIFARWDKHPWAGKHAGISRLNRLIEYVAHLGIRKGGWVVLAFVVCLALGVPQLWQVEAETDLYQFFPDSHPITQSTKRAEKSLSGVTTLEVVFDAPARDDLKEPARLGLIKAFQTWAEDLPEVDRTLSMSDIVEEMHWAFHSENEEYRTIPQDRRLISQYILIYDGQDLYDLVDREFQRTRVTLNLNVHGANAISNVINKIDAYLTKSAPGDLKWQMAGIGRLFAEQQDLLIQGQVRGLWGALGLIFALMALLWRSLPVSLLCMVPNVSPILLIFIIMGAAGIWLDMATAMIASVAVGIAVDDTIHIYHGYRSRRKTGTSPVWALGRSYRQAGRAVTATTLVLCAQFLLLAGSQFIPTAQFGLLTAIGLVAALVFDLLLLPAMITVSWRLLKR